MYVPRFNALDDDAAIRAMVPASASAELVTVGEDGYPLATRLPVVWDGDRLVMHIARANPHWRSIPSDADVPALAVVTDAEAYVSPAWYATKAEHGRVVPTWNYSAVHVTGRVRRHEDPEWIRHAVTMLTEQHESGRRALGGDRRARDVRRQAAARHRRARARHRAGRGQGRS